MDRLRNNRERKVFTGFTSAEVEKMEKVLNESREKATEMELCKKLTRSFNSSSGRAGKPVLKWTEVQSWLQNKLADLPSKDNSVNGSNKTNPGTCQLENDKPNESTPTSEGQTGPDPPKLEFEAKSSKDGAWYDVDEFKTCRKTKSGEMEALVRFNGFESDEDEWVNVKESVRERSLGLEPSECQMLKVGDQVLCFQERRDLAKYFDAHIVDIKRRVHDIRGCRCVFSIKYDHDNIEEKVGLTRVCRILTPAANIRDSLP